MAAKTYFVHFLGAKMGRRRKELAEVRGPYTLKSAKSYARISSQYGDPTEVREGKNRGAKLVRRYVGGKREWPVTPKAVKKLKKSQQPKKRHVGGSKGTLLVKITRVKKAQFAIVPVSPKHDQQMRWAVEQSIGKPAKGPLALVGAFPEAESLAVGKSVQVRAAAKELEKLIDATWGTKIWG